MLTELCQELRNWFVKSESEKHFGDFLIQNGMIEPLDFLKDGQYFRIVGSDLNDGVYQYPASNLMDEHFTGAVWAMAVPPAVIALADKIRMWQDNESAQPSPFTSESFGGYSYTKATGANGAPLTWQEYFKKDLNNWRKI